MAAIGHPIVGDGKYGGPEAFLSGSISRKMHLHARRLLIDHPDGDEIDVTAPLPEHFAASMAQLGFDEELGSTLPEPPKVPERAAKKAAAKAHAKQYRKERRGERRGRGATAKGPVKGPAGPAKGSAGPARGPASPAKPAQRGPTKPRRG
jgi:23S rRNA pseudouridine955/2504/2580 synthase